MSIPELLREHSPAFTAATVRHLYLEQPEARTAFPTVEAFAQLGLTQLLATYIEATHTADTPTPPQAVREVERAGVDFRRFGFPAPTYMLLARALRRALRELVDSQQLDYSAEVARAEELIETVCAHLAKAALAADFAGIPAAHGGEVISVEHPCRRVSVVTLDLGIPLDYQPGQTVLATTPLLQGQWVRLAPAVPSTEFGQVEFHIFQPHDAMPSPLARAHEGDLWTFGQPEGSLRIPTSGTLVLLAHGVGYAQARAIILDLMSSPNPPQVHLFWLAEYPGELYELERLLRLSDAHPWLHVTGIADHPEDAWWVRPADPTTAHVQLRQPGATLASMVPPELSDATFLAFGPNALEADLPLGAQIVSW